MRDAELKTLQQEKEQLQQTLNERMALAGANDRAREAELEQQQKKVYASPDFV